MNKHTKSLVICISLVMINKKHIKNVVSVNTLVMKIKKHTKSVIICVMLVMKIKTTYKKNIYVCYFGFLTHLGRFEEVGMWVMMNASNNQNNNNNQAFCIIFDFHNQHN